MEFTAVRAAKDFSNEQFAKTSLMLVERRDPASLTRDKGTDASTADTRNVCPWA